MSDTPSQETEEAVPSDVSHTDIPNVIKEVNNEPKVGEYIGQCKWFNDNLGFGFLTIQNTENKGKDIFVHHSGIRPLNSNYKTLKKGEYVNFDIVEGDNGQQAYNVTGIGGGSLICDVTPYHKPVNHNNVYQKPITHPVPIRTQNVNFRPPRQAVPVNYRVNTNSGPPRPPYKNIENRRGFVGTTSTQYQNGPNPKYNKQPNKIATLNH
jgi:CspA family cold shock protein